MRYMILVKATKESEAGAMPSEDIFNAMADYHEELTKAGVLVDGNGLHPSSKGWRITWEGDRKAVTDGPFAETKELIAGFTIIRVNSKEEALDWANRFPRPFHGDGEIEVRQMFEIEDFDDSPGIERFRDLEVGKDRH